MDDPNTENIGADEEKENSEEDPKPLEETPTKPVKGSGEEVDNQEFKEYQKVVKTTGFRQFSESAKEALRLKTAKDKAEAEARELKTELEGYKSSDEIPLDEKELIKKYPDWDNLLDSEKVNIQTMERLKIKQDRLDKELKKEKQDRLKKEEEARFENNFRKVLANPVFADDLKGREEEFKEFCYRDENLGITDLIVLAKSFLFDVVKNKKKDEETPPGEGLEPGTGGNKQAPPKEGMTIEEVDALRKSNPRKYNEMIRDGKLKMIE